MLPSFLVRRVAEGAHSPGRAPVGMEGGGVTEVVGDPRGAGWRSPVGMGLLLLTEQCCMHIRGPNSWRRGTLGSGVTTSMAGSCPHAREWAAGAEWSLSTRLLPPVYRARVTALGLGRR